MLPTQAAHLLIGPLRNEAMAEMVGIPEIAKRLKLDGGTVRRLIARVGDTLGIELHRGKGDKLLLSR